MEGGIGICLDFTCMIGESANSNNIALVVATWMLNNPEEGCLLFESNTN